MASFAQDFNTPIGTLSVRASASASAGIAAPPQTTDAGTPIGAFAFQVSASVAGLNGGREKSRGAFSDVSGL